MDRNTKQEIEDLIAELRKAKIHPDGKIQKQKHVSYLKHILHKLGQSIIYFDVAQPWIYYYILHSLKILRTQPTQKQKHGIKTALSYCLNEGYGGGYLQLPHLAPTYAAFLTLIELGPQYIKLIDRQKMAIFLKKCKKGGRFQMHVDGQCDLRGSYIATIIIKLLKLPEDLLQGVADTIIESQTYEGGIANTIGGQAHGGFTFCGVAALALLGRVQDLDVSRLMSWLSQRQVQFGGFNGRTAKLLDSCYSFWIGAVFNILDDYFKGTCSIQGHLLYCQKDLERYVIVYCQDFQKGGLFDKPGKARDMYHTCYSLSGLTLCQSRMEKEQQQNRQQLVKVDPIYNVTIEALDSAIKTFKSVQQLK